MGRAREYAFVLYAMLVAAAYAVAHDHATATISPEYFLYGKGLAQAPQSFRWAVTRLALRASLAPGLFGGALLLVANNPRPNGHPPQLSYRALMMLSLLPVAAAGALAAVLGVVNASMQIGTATALALGVVPYRVWRFVIVLAIHIGSYAGAVLGSVAAAITVWVRRRAPSRRADPTEVLPDAVRSRPRSKRIRGPALVPLGYLALCLAARVGYRVLLYPAPPDPPFVPPDGAKLLSIHADDGAQQVALMGISLGTGDGRSRTSGRAGLGEPVYVDLRDGGGRPSVPATGLLCPDRFDTLSKASRIHVPTLVIHGDVDEVVPFAMGERVAAAIAGAGLRVVRGGHHNDLFVDDRGDLEDAIAEQAKR